MSKLICIGLKGQHMGVAGLALLLCVGAPLPARAQSGPAQTYDALDHGVVRPAAPKSGMPVGRVAEIAIDSRPPFYFPAELNIEVGDVVTWANPEKADPHTVYDEAGEFSSPQITPGSQWCRQFVREGDYSYSCRIHPWMRGVVHVHSKNLAMRDLALPEHTAVVALDADRGQLWLRSRTALLLIQENANHGTKIVQRITVPSSRRPLFDNRGNAWFPGLQPGSLIRVSLDVGSSQLMRVHGLSGTLVPLAAGPGDDIWVCNPQSKQVLHLRSADAQTIGRFSADEVVLDAPVLASRDGLLWITAKAGKSIISINARTGDRTEYLLGEGAQIKALREAPHEVIWAADVGRGKLLKIENRWTTEYTIPSSYSSPVDLQVDSRGWIWFTEMQTNKIGVLRSGGAFDEYRVPATTRGPASLRFDHMGNLWFLAVTSARLGQITSTTVAALDQAASSTLPECAATHSSGSRPASSEVHARPGGD